MPYSVHEMYLEEFVEPYRFSLDDYQKMVRVGILEERMRYAELIHGQVVRMGSMNPAHRNAVIRITKLFVNLFSNDYEVSAAVPVEVTDDSAPEPDFALIAFGTPIRKAAPCTAELILELSDTTLRYDRKIKGSLYAKGGVQEYWILNLLRRTLEVRRNPQPDAKAAFGYSYASLKVLDETRSCSPLTAPHVSIRVMDLVGPPL